MRSLLLTLLVPLAASAADYHVYFGTYTRGDSPSEGIYRADFNDETGKLGAPELVAELFNPSFLELAPDGAHLYAVGEVGQEGSGVNAFAIEASTGGLTALNSVSAVGAGPCHINLDSKGRMVGIANYGSGSTVSYAVQEDGRLSDSVSVQQHEGSSVNPKRQTGPHAHSINFSPDDRFAYVCDLGLDQVLIYRTNPEDGSLEPADPAFAEVPAGGGPRHLAFHPNGRFVYVNNELTLTCSVFEQNSETGALTLIETVSTLPEGEGPEQGLSTAETRVHPNGRFVYVSNRGHDTIAVFECDPETGRLTLVQNADCEGSIPRNFNLDPSGKWALVGHQKSHTVAVFAVDEGSGKLTFTGDKIQVGAPVCIRFLAR